MVKLAAPSKIKKKYPSWRHTIYIMLTTKFYALNFSVRNYLIPRLFVIFTLSDQTLRVENCLENEATRKLGDITLG